MKYVFNLSIPIPNQTQHIIKQSQIRLTYLMSDVLKNHLQEESVLFQTAHFRDYLLVTDQITQTVQSI